MSTIGTDITTRVNLVAGCFNKNKEDRIMQTASKWLILANAIIAVSADASAQNIDVGKAEYQSACASCHGIDAKGNGPVN